MNLKVELKEGKMFLKGTKISIEPIFPRVARLIFEENGEIILAPKFSETYRLTSSGKTDIVKYGESGWVSEFAKKRAGILLNQKKPTSLFKEIYGENKTGISVKEIFGALNS